MHTIRRQSRMKGFGAKPEASKPENKWTELKSQRQLEETFIRFYWGIWLLLQRLHKLSWLVNGSGQILVVFKGLSHCQCQETILDKTDFHLKLNFGYGFACLVSILTQKVVINLRLMSYRRFFFSILAKDDWGLTI